MEHGRRAVRIYHQSQYTHTRLIRTYGPIRVLFTMENGPKHEYWLEHSKSAAAWVGWSDDGKLEIEVFEDPSVDTGRWYYGLAIHELVHAVFFCGVQECECRQCTIMDEEISQDGKTGHGIPWQEVMKELDKYMDENFDLEFTGVLDRTGGAAQEISAREYNYDSLPRQEIGFWPSDPYGFSEVHILLVLIGFLGREPLKEKVEHGKISKKFALQSWKNSRILLLLPC